MTMYKSGMSAERTDEELTNETLQQLTHAEAMVWGQS